MNRILLTKNDRIAFPPSGPGGPEQDGGWIEIRDPDTLTHLAVLRMRRGEELELLSPENETLFLGRAAESPRRGLTSARFALTGQRALRPDPVRITLYQGIPKGSKLDTIVRQTTECGVCAVVPYHAVRSVAEGRFDDKKLRRLQKIAEEAALQSKRERIPAVLPPIGTDGLIDALSVHDHALVFYEEAVRPLKEALRSIAASSGIAGTDVGVVIGPEGGIDGEELRRIVSGVSGIEIVSLGSRILRTETAGIAAVSNILYEMEG